MSASTRPPQTLTRRQRLRIWLRRKWILTRWLSKLAAVLVIILSIVYWKRIFVSIDPGHAGVLWKRFQDGTELCKNYGEGLHVIGPWDRMYVYDTRTLQLPFNTVLYTVDGLNITASGSLRYHLNSPLLSYLQTAMGPDYEEKLLRPLAISAVRKVLGDFSPHQIYSEDEKGLLQKLRNTLEADLKDVFRFKQVATPCEPYRSGGYLYVEEFLLLQINLPARVESSIQYKVEQEQYAQAYEYILKREKQERARRTIEAEGIREFEEKSGISITKWRGIEATEKLATAPNSKVIIMGTGMNQLPLLLNTDGGPAVSKPEDGNAGPSREGPEKAERPAGGPGLGRNPNPPVQRQR